MDDSISTSEEEEKPKLKATGHVFQVSLGWGGAELTTHQVEGLNLIHLPGPPGPPVPEEAV